MSVRVSMTLFNSTNVVAWHQCIYVLYKCISSLRVIANTLLMQPFAVIF